MLRSLSILLILSLSLYWYATVGIVCPTPLTYAITTPIDERFDITTAEAEAAVERAAAVWEEGLGRDLFTPAVGTNADIEIRFVFDDRQERELAEEALRESLEDKQLSSSDLQASYEALAESYRDAKATYDADVAAYNTRLDTYNRKVASYNETGGAPADVFDQLASEEAALAAEADALETEATRLQNLATEINALGEVGNSLIRQYNAGVNRYNTQFGEIDEFTQGDYQSGLVSIYTFTDAAELDQVLAHELGHSLSLPHVEGSASIMYYLLEDQPAPLALSDTDQAALIATCGETGAISTKVRTLVNRYLF
jgi:Matrixin